jgi:hypothetical protein
MRDNPQTNQQKIIKSHRSDTHNSKNHLQLTKVSFKVDELPSIEIIAPSEPKRKSSDSIESDKRK